MAEVKANSRTAAALYARVSTSDQNCGLQLEELRRYASQRFSSVFEFVDIGVSGTEPRRSQLDALMRGARKRRFDAVLVWKFDRFGRSLKHLLDSLEEFHSLGIDFISLTEGIDTTTPTGKLVFGIMGSVSQFERDLIAERVRAGIAHARRLGKRIGRPACRSMPSPSSACETKGCLCARLLGSSTSRSRVCGAPWRATRVGVSRES